MATPTFIVSGTPLDVGLPGGARHTAGIAYASCSVPIGELHKARSTFTFLRFRGLFKTAMGPQSQEVTWVLVLRANTAATMRAIEADIKALIENGTTGTLTDSLGNTYDIVLLAGYAGDAGARGYDVVRSGPMSGWVRKEGWLRFEVLG